MMKKKDILVVDDDPIIREICKTNLQTVGYHVRTAENGEEALASLKQSKTDLVVLDRMMPKLDGEEVLNRVRRNELTKNLPIIFLTAKSSIEDVTDGLRLGANDYLIKPFSVSNLIEHVNKALERHYLVNGDEEDWKKRGDTVKSSVEITFQYPSDIPGVIYALTRDLQVRNIKGLKLGLFESINNAVYHGNLEMDSAMKQGSNGFAEYEELAHQRIEEEKYGNRWVRVRMEQNSSRIQFTIVDSGGGFEWDNLPNPDDNEALTYFAGRGIMLTRFYYHSVTWNDKGNEITLTHSLVHPHDEMATT